MEPNFFYLFLSGALKVKCRNLYLICKERF